MFLMPRARLEYRIDIVMLEQEDDTSETIEIPEITELKTKVTLDIRILTKK